MNQKSNNIENIPKEELDEPLNNKKEQPPQLTETLLKQNKLDKTLFNTIKGHKLLGWCLLLLFIIYLIEMFKNNGNLSEISKITVEIIKLIIFSLMGYLFGTNGTENK